jgi:LPS-assembly protein
LEESFQRIVLNLQIAVNVPKFKNCFSIFALVTGYWLLVTDCYAQQEKEPVIVDGDSVEFLSQRKQVIAKGHVVVRYQDAILTCDKAIVYTDTKDVLLEGDVKLFQEGSVVSGERAIYNLQTKKGSVLKTHLKAEPWYSGAKEADRVGKGQADVQSGYITSCNLDRPHYRIKAKAIKIFLEDRVQAKDAVFYLGDYPIFYLPFYNYSLRERWPKVRVTPGKDKDWGYYVLTAWRYEFSGQAKGLINVDFRDRKDVAVGVDHYYDTINIGDFGSGLFRTYYMKERNIQSDHIWKTPRHTEELQRYRVQLRHEWDIDRESELVLEYNRYSDNNFLKDYFYRRDYERFDAPETYVSFTRTKPSHTLNFFAKKRANRWESVTEELPRIRLDANRQIIGKGRGFDSGLPQGAFGVLAEKFPLYYKSENEFTNFNQKSGHSEEDAAVLKFDTYNELSSSLRPVRWLSFTPLVGIRQTWFSRKVEDDEEIIRGVFYTGADLSTKIFRLFEVESDFLGMEIHKLKHIVTPTIEYRYNHAPTVPSSKLLQSGGIDRNNRVTLSLENKLQTKRPFGRQERKIVDLATLILSTNYDFKLENGSTFSNITADLELFPYNWLRIESDASYNPHTRDFETVNLDLYADGGDKWKLGFGSRYVQNTSTELTAEFSWRLSPKWRVSAYQRFMIKGYPYGIKKINDFREQELRVSRDLHCWVADLIYNVSEGVNVWLVFRLKAFPEEPIEMGISYHQPKPGTQQPIR